MRLFIAWAPDDASRHRLAQISTLPEDNLHLTCLFPGSTKEEKVPEILSHLKEDTIKASSRKEEWWPDCKGTCLHVLTFDPQPFENTYHALLEALDFREERTFRPHVTLARRVEAAPHTKVCESDFVFTGPYLYASDLSGDHPVYTRLL